MKAVRKAMEHREDLRELVQFLRNGAPAARPPKMVERMSVEKGILKLRTNEKVILDIEDLRKELQEHNPGYFGKGGRDHSITNQIALGTPEGFHQIGRHHEGGDVLEIELAARHLVDALTNRIPEHIERTHRLKG